MRHDLIRRVRWGNVALAGAALLAVVCVVAWPLLSTPAPGLPPDAARPLVSAAPPPAPAASAKPGAEGTPEAHGVEDSAGEEGAPGEPAGGARADDADHG